MIRFIRISLTLAIAFGALGAATDAAAQAADAKRNLKAMKLFYKEPGMIEVDIKAMRQTLMLTGSVPTEEHKAQADELAAKVRGIKDIRNRIRVRDPEVSAASAEENCAKIESKIQDFDDLAQARRKFEIECEGSHVKLTGKLPDYAIATTLVRYIRDIPAVKTINFDKLKY